MTLFHATTFDYTIKPLSFTNLPDIMLLQQHILEALPPAHKNFILPKTPAQFVVRMHNKGQMLGAFVGHKLIAYGGVAYAEPSWPTADMVLNPEALPCAPEELAIIQSSAVHPFFRKQGVHHQLLLAREELCLNHAKTHLMAEVAANNVSSLKSMMATNFIVDQAGIDQKDQCPLLFLHKELNGAAAPLAAHPSLSISLKGAHAKLMALLSSGYKGKSLLFFPNTASPALQLHTLAL